jgi:hypothetical protein
MDVCVCISGLASGWSPSKEFYRLSKVRKLKWNEACHECPMLQVGATGIEEEEEEYSNIWFVYYEFVVLTVVW